MDDRDRDCQISRLVFEAAAAQRTIVVVALVIVVMKGHREGGKHQQANAKKRQTLKHGVK